MKSNNLWGRIVAVAALLLLVAGGTAFAQLQTGNLYGTVTGRQRRCAAWGHRDRPAARRPASPGGRTPRGSSVSWVSRPQPTS